MFIKKIALLSAIGVMVTSASAESMKLTTASGVEFGVQASSYKYEEPALMQNKGQKIGFSVAVTRALDQGIYVKGDLRYASGTVDYSSPFSGKANGNSDNLWEGRITAGYDVPMDGFLLSPFAGLGQRSLFNDSRGFTNLGYDGYRRKSEYTYLTLGATHRFAVGNDARISTSLEYNHLLRGRQTTRFSDLGPAYAAVFGDPVNAQKNGHGFRLSSDYEMGNWSVGGFVGVWKIGKSATNYYKSGATTYSLYEPENKTREFGVNVKYRF